MKQVFYFAYFNKNPDTLDKNIRGPSVCQFEKAHPEGRQASVGAKYYKD